MEPSGRAAPSSSPTLVEKPRRNASSTSGQTVASMPCSRTGLRTPPRVRAAAMSAATSLSGLQRLFLDLDQHAQRQRRQAQLHQPLGIGDAGEAGLDADTPPVQPLDHGWGRGFAQIDRGMIRQLPPAADQTEPPVVVGLDPGAGADPDQRPRHARTQRSQRRVDMLRCEALTTVGCPDMQMQLVGPGSDGLGGILRQIVQLARAAADGTRRGGPR